MKYETALLSFLKSPLLMILFLTLALAPWALSQDPPLFPDLDGPLINDYEIDSSRPSASQVLDALGAKLVGSSKIARVDREGAEIFSTEDPSYRSSELLMYEIDIDKLAELADDGSLMTLADPLSQIENVETVESNFSDYLASKAIENGLSDSDINDILNNSEEPNFSPEAEQPRSSRAVATSTLEASAVFTPGTKNCCTVLVPVDNSCGADGKPWFADVYDILKKDPKRWAPNKCDVIQRCDYSRCDRLPPTYNCYENNPSTGVTWNNFIKNNDCKQVVIWQAGHSNGGNHLVGIRTAGPWLCYRDTCVVSVRLLDRGCSTASDLPALCKRIIQLYENLRKSPQCDLSNPDRNKVGIELFMSEIEQSNFVQGGGHIVPGNLCWRNAQDGASYDHNKHMRVVVTCDGIGFSSKRYKDGKWQWQPHSIEQMKRYCGDATFIDPKNPVPHLGGGDGGTLPSLPPSDCISVVQLICAAADQPDCIKFKKHLEDAGVIFDVVIKPNDTKKTPRLYVNDCKGVVGEYTTEAGVLGIIEILPINEKCAPGTETYILILPNDATQAELDVIKSLKDAGIVFEEKREARKAGQRYPRLEKIDCHGKKIKIWSGVADILSIDWDMKPISLLEPITSAEVDDVAPATIANVISPSTAILKAAITDKVTEHVEPAKPPKKKYMPHKSRPSKKVRPTRIERLNKSQSKLEKNKHVYAKNK